jgi:hypothetical protein
MAQKNRANMLTDIVSNIYNNLINFITGQNAQDRFVNLLDSSPNILSDASQANGYVSTDANNEMFSSYYDEEISRADLISDLTANLAVGGKFYRINDAVGTTITLLVIAESNINLYSIGTDIATGEQGTYDITTDVFTPIVVSGTPDLQQVLDTGNISTTTFRIDDGAGNYVRVGTTSILIEDASGNQSDFLADSFSIQNPSFGSGIIKATTLAHNVTFELPNKAAGTETFAMLSDVTSLVATVTAGTNISVTGTATNPIINSLADRYSTSSISTNDIDNGNGKVFTVDANLAYIPLQEVLIVNAPSKHMHGTVVSYSGTTLTVDINSHTGTGTYSSWVINLDGTPVDAITGVGTANEIAYFTSGQVIASLPVATYPSLTELSYVKGATSAIQTQLNSKVTFFASAADGAANAALSIANTISISVLIPANTFALDDVIRINHRVRVSGVAATRETRVYANTSASLTGAILVSTATLTSTTLAANLQRFLAIKNATTNTEVISATTSLLTDYNNVPSPASVTTLNINWTVDQYIIFAVNATGTGADSIRATMYSIEKL